MEHNITLNFDGKRYSLEGEKPEMEEKILMETLNCMATKSLNSAVEEPEDAVAYATHALTHASILSAIQEQLTIPLLSDIIDYTGKINVPVVFEGVKCEVEMKKAELEPYVLIQVKNKDHLFGNYAVGFNGEFLMGDVLDVLAMEGDEDEDEFIEYYIAERDDEFALFAIVQAMDEIQRQLIRKLKDYQKKAC